MKNNLRIVISGTVGIGKSTVTEALVKRLGEEGNKVNYIKEETVDSIYLDYYYKSPQDWAFVAQLDFLLGRFKQWLTDERTRDSQNDYITVYDRHFIDDYVFAELHTIKQNISQFNSLTYQAVYKELLEKLSKKDARPDFFILLTAPLETIIDRLKGRGRGEELDVDMDYWQDLYSNYYNRPMFRNHFKSNVKNFVEVSTENKQPEQIVSEIMEILGK